MEEEIVERVVDRIFKKCGEILFTVESGERIYSFTCISCNEIYGHIEEFATHIDIQHSDDLQFKLDEQQEVAANVNDCVEEFNDEPEYAVVDSDLATSHGVAAELVQHEEEFMKVDVDVEEFIRVEEDEEEVGEEHTVKDEHVLEPQDSDDDVDDDMTMGENEADSDIESDINPDEASIGILPCDSSMSSTDQKVLTLAVILDYEKQRTLWHPEMETNEVQFKNEAYDKIAASINKELGLQLNRQNVKKMIRKLNGFYRTELKKQTQANALGQKYTLPWYFDKLRFLEQRTKDEDSNSGINKGLGLPLPYLNDEQHTEIFETYKSFPCLWDVQHIGFHTKKLRQEAMEQMTQALKNKMDLHYTPEQLQRKLYHIRYTCTQEKQRKLECEKLKKQFKPQCKFYDQLVFLEDNVHPFKCPYCDDVFNAPQPYNVHKAKHDGSRPFKCPVCNRGFMTAGNCTVHLRRHTQEFPYSCKICGKAFPSSSEVTIHMRYHSGEKPYVCEVCGLSFYRPSYLDYHKRRHENNRSFKCTECPKAFYDNHLLKEHMKVHLNIRDQICNLCGKAFTCTKHLRQHKQIHAAVKKYACKICGKNFAQYAGLSGHMKSHGTTISGVKDLVDTGILE